MNEEEKQLLYTDCSYEINMLIAKLISKYKNKHFVLHSLLQINVEAVLKLSYIVNMHIEDLLQHIKELNKEGFENFKETKQMMTIIKSMMPKKDDDN